MLAVASHSFLWPRRRSAVHLTDRSCRSHTLVKVCDIYSMLSFRASVFTNHCGGPSLSTPSPLLPMNIEAFDERISSCIYFIFSYALCEVRSEARSLGQEQVLRGVRQEGQVQEGRRDEALSRSTRRQSAEYTPTINTLGNIVTGNIRNTVKKPWSALNGGATPLGCQLPTSAHKNLQSLATTPLTR